MGHCRSRSSDVGNEAGAFSIYFANITTWGPKAQACIKEIAKEHQVILLAENAPEGARGQEARSMMESLGLRGKFFSSQAV